MSTDHQAPPTNDESEQPLPTISSEDATPQDYTLNGTVCHVEDIRDPCRNPNCEVHTAANTPAISRNVSVANLKDLNMATLQNQLERSNEVAEVDAGSSIEKSTGSLEQEEPINEQIAQEPTTTEEHVAIEEPTAAEDPTGREQAATPVSSQEPSDPASPPPPQTSVTQQEDRHEDTTTQEDTAPPPELTEKNVASVESPLPLDSAQMSADGAEAAAPGSPPTESVSTSDPMDTPAQSEPSPESQKAKLNWDFDNPEALKEHVVGDEDAFARLRDQAPERSASFPPVPEPVQKEADEQSILAMMASEVATTEQEQNPFNDSPSADKPVSELFGSGEQAAEDEGSFFNQLGNGTEKNAAQEAPMGGDYPGDNDNMTQEDEERHDEGIPLMSTKRQSELVVNSKDELDFFSDDAETDDNFFGSPTVENHQSFGEIERKDTEQVINNAMHSYHSAEGVAASMTTAASQVFAEAEADSAEKVDDLFAGVETNDADYFGQLGQQQVESPGQIAESPGPIEESSQPVQQAPTHEESPAQVQVQPAQEDDVAAKWKAALASDEFLDDDEGMLTSDDEGFLPSDDEDPFPAPLAPVTTVDGQLQGFSAVSTQSQVSAHAQQPPQQSAVDRYAPKQAQQPQQWNGPPPIPEVQQPVVSAGYQQLAPPQTLRSSQSAYFSSGSSPYAQARPGPPVQKPESFVDKKKGYTSPYDLPTDLDPPVRRKPHAPQGYNQYAPGSVPPARTTSFGTPGVNPPPQTGPPSQKQAFFEDLPVAPPKQRAASAMGRYAPPPQAAAPPMTRGNSFQQPPRPGSVQGQYAPPPQLGQPAIISPQQTPGVHGIQPTVLVQQQIPFQQPTQEYQPAPQARYATPPLGQSAAPPLAPAVAVSPAQKPVSNKYAPRQSGPPQVPRAPSGQYAMPPTQPPVQAQYQTPQAPMPQQQQQPALMSPPVHQLPPQQTGIVSPPAQQFMPQQQPANVPQAFQQVPPQQGLPQQYVPQQAHPQQYAPQQAPPQQAPPQQALSQQYPPQQIAPQQYPLQQYQPQQAPPPQMPETARRGSGDHVLHSSRPGTATGLAPTMEPPREEEELREEQAAVGGEQGNIYPPAAPPPPKPSTIAAGKYAPVNRGTATPPPPNGFTSPPPMAIPQNVNLLSPKNQIARTVSPVPMTFQPPPRAATSSPGFLHGKPKGLGVPQAAPYERPVSALAQSAMPKNYPAPEPVFQQPRKPSVQINFLKPEGLAATDPLKRWQGAPVFTWGFGGSITTMFPVRTQRFTSDGTAPLTKCSPGEVKFRTLNDVLALPEGDVKFPGPVWNGNKSANKAKKKEVMTYMDARIEGFEKEVAEHYDPVSRRDVEQTALLWKVVKQMVENDGAVEGTPEIQAGFRKILTPELSQIAENGNSDAGFVSMAGIPSMQTANAETVDASAVQEFKQKLVLGEHEKAVWHAVDKRLWAHALLIANTVSKDLWHSVVHEFVKSEVKTLGEGSESLAVLYETLAGNHNESVDELVPQSARMGMPMLSTAQTKEQSLEERLAKWRETLMMILSTRSPGDQASILALGQLLNGYGWVGAAHVCFIFARQIAPNTKGAVFGGAQEPATTFALLGADHTRGGEWAKNLDTIMLSEIYEFAVSLSPQAAVVPTFPHLQVWKLHHAIVLTETGRKTDAQKYCDAIAASAKVWNGRNHYFHPAFFHALEDLTKRLQEAPRDTSAGTGGSKWIPKLTSDTVSTSMWGAFNKFVSGDEPKEGEAKDPEGPFQRITPDVSRNQSSVDLYSAYQGGSGYPNQSSNNSPTASRAPSMGAAQSRYAPGGRTSQESTRPSGYDLRRTSTDTSRGAYEGGYPGGAGYGQQTAYQPTDQQPGSNYTSPRSGAFGPSSGYQPRQSLDSTPEVSEKTTSYGGYNSYEPTTAGTTSSGGYEPPSNSGGYEPPSDNFVPYQPEPDHDDEAEATTKPKKKMLDDDDDDAEFAKRAEAVKKADEERKRKEEEEAKKKKQETPEGGKKGWFGGWFGRGGSADGQQSGPIKAKLGEESSFVYDPDLKRWINKKAGDTAAPAPKAAPPPRRTPTPSASGTGTPAPPMVTATPPVGSPAPPRGGTPNPPLPSASAPPPGPSSGLAPPPPGTGPPSRGPSPAPPMGGRSVSAGPRPAPTGDIMDELLGPPTSRRGTPAARKKKGASRYVEVIPGQQ